MTRSQLLPVEIRTRSKQRFWGMLSYALVVLMPLFKSEFKSQTIFMKMILHEIEPVVATTFHINGFTLRLVLTKRQ